MSFKVSDNKTTRSYGKVVRNFLNIKFDREPIYDDHDKYIGAEMKIYDDNVNTNFHGKKYQNKILHVNACH